MIHVGIVVQLQGSLSGIAFNASRKAREFAQLRPNSSGTIFVQQHPKKLPKLHVLDCTNRCQLQLREHPRMTYGGSRSWPPLWVQNTRGGVKKVAGELGVLNYVHTRHQPATKCFLVMKYQNETFVGTLLFEDQTFGAKISELLRGLVGKPLKEIGDLELPEVL
jgi:hypothetical protein